ncbi:thioredoxin domain-containing protein [Candidatus Kaiserbacteria bacterium]|nr:thioredoxin domain-containing protein [Candidatus Kaiserbacteria bacterium]
MEALQKFSVPISIVIAGAMIAAALFYVNSNKAAGPAGPGEGQVLTEIRTVQADDHILGNPEAEIVVVEFSDPECPFCKQFHETMHQIVSEYGSSGKVAWVYRHFPIEQLHPKAPKEAEALECAAEQGGNETFWKFTDMVYEKTGSNNALDIGVHNSPKEVPVGPDGEPYYAQKAPRSNTDAGQLSDFAKELGLNVEQFENCIQSGKYASRVSTDYNEVAAAGGQGTPHSILIVNGDQVPLEGAQPYNVVKGLIDTLLE